MNGPKYEFFSDVFVRNCVSQNMLYYSRGQRQVEQELSDTREQVVDLQNSNASLTNAKRKLDSDIHQIQARVDFS